MVARREMGSLNPVRLETRQSTQCLGHLPRLDCQIVTLPNGIIIEGSTAISIIMQGDVNSVRWFGI